MRASTLFALTIAILIGLVVAITARVSGWFSTPAEVVVAKRAEVAVLVANKNLFGGDVIDGTGVRVRALRQDELEHYRKHKDQYMAPTVNAALMRIPNKDIEAETPILRDMLLPMTKPTGLPGRLQPQMRAANADVPKDRCAGGQIQLGDWVDVLLTTTVSMDGKSSTLTSCIVSKARVIAKRDSLWQVFAPLPEGKPVHFTLEMNPYRAALFEFSKTKGQITLVPLPSSEQKKLEKLRDGVLQEAGLVSAGAEAPSVFVSRALRAPSLMPIAAREEEAQEEPVLFVQQPPQEAENDEARIAAYNKNDLTVSEADLVRIFGLKTSAPPVEPPPNIEIERYIGLMRYDSASYTQTGKVVVPGRPGARVSNGYPATTNVSTHSFSAPSFQFRAPDCPTCDVKTKSRKN